MSDIFDNEDDVIEGVDLRSNPTANSPVPELEPQRTAQYVSPLNRPTIKVKERIPAGSTTPGEAKAVKIGEHELTPEEVIALSNRLEETFRAKMKAENVNTKKAVVDLDYTQLSLKDVYNLQIPIEAKAFGANDPLKVDLKDKNYEARWVYKSPRRLGQMRTYGFHYVHADDLAVDLAVEVTPDAEGHFILDDVVLMKIPKVKYYAMMRANFERAINTVSNLGAAKAAKVAAETFMVKQAGGDFAEAAEQGKINFYRPAIEI